MQRLRTSCLLKVNYLLAIFFFFAIIPVFSQTPDATFGTSGKVTTPINDSATANAVAIQTNGKIIVAGSTIVNGNEYATLIRYNVDGSLDNTFGTGGIVVSLVPDVRRINAVAIQQDGKIVAGGISNNGSTFNGDFTLIRYKVDGGIDSLFGNNGISKVSMRGIGMIKKIIVRSDGKILAGGTLALPTFDNIPALALLNTNGIVDSSFGVNGRFQNYVNNDTTMPRMISDMAFASDGKIVATGETGDYRTAFAVFRYLPNGIIDSAFGVKGLVNTGFYNTSNYDAYAESVAIAVLPDNKIVAAGYSYKSQIGTRFSMVKLNTNGSLDSTFGTAGKVIAQTGLANHLLTDADGNLNLSGYTTETSNPDFAVAKYFANGKPDSTFGINGIVTTDFTGFADQSYASVMQPDGKIILAGQAGNSNNKYSIAVARYTMNVMPFKLLSFTAQANGKNNFLSWKTAQEINVDRFVIERSFNGKDYIGIGNVNAGSATYSFIDDKPLNGTNYYRLKMIDKDGKYAFSQVKSIVSRNGFFVKVYPIPAKGKLNMQIVAAQTEEATISVSDLSGEELIRNTTTISAGINNTVMNVENLIAGVYFLKIITTAATETIKVTIAK